MPASDSGDDLVGVLGPAEGSRVCVGFGEKAIDSSLEGDEGVEHAALQPPFGQFGKEALDGIDPGETAGLRRDAEVGVK